jgi:enoyl-CoA hydratase/carnithine racemase
MSVMEIKWGLIPDMSATQSLRRLLPLDVALELTLTGRVVSGTEVKEIGLATRVSASPREDALALAAEIAGKSPDAVRAAKRLFQEAWHAAAPAFARRELQRGLTGVEPGGVGSRTEKRAPRFVDPS